MHLGGQGSLALSSLRVPSDLTQVFITQAPLYLQKITRISASLSMAVS